MHYIRTAKNIETRSIQKDPAVFGHYRASYSVNLSEHTPKLGQQVGYCISLFYQFLLGFVHQVLTELADLKILNYLI